MSPDVTQQSIAHWVENSFYKWAICLNPDSIVGDISVVDRDDTVNVSGSVLSKTLARRREFNRVTARFNSQSASGRVIFAGMSSEGTFRQAVFHKGQVKIFRLWDPQIRFKIKKKKVRLA